MKKIFFAVIGVLSMMDTYAEEVTPIPVQVSVLEAIVDQADYRAPARVVNEQHLDISVEISGLLNTFEVRVGDRVAKGDVLARFDCQDYQLLGEQARQSVVALNSQLTLAQQQLKRARALQKTGSASVELLNQRQTEFNALSAQVKGQQIHLQQAERDISRCEVKAPFAGVVTQVKTTAGAWLSVGSPVLRLLSDNGMEVSANLQQHLLSTLDDAGKIVFRLGQDSYPLKLRSSIPFINETTRTQEARFIFERGKALTGAVGELVWQSSELRLPPEYLVKREGVLGVMLADAGKARFLPLADAREGQSVNVELSPDVLVIIQGQHVVNDGSMIFVESATTEKVSGAMDNATTSAQ